ncbi:nucleotidyltransferase domain-containing protein [Neomegalonema sp.]|uniref:DNA polymerase beta superfamily protein n=1 Tax=Neomegalonema sp. TaxID=2039713 RepID=UPI00345BE685
MIRGARNSPRRNLQELVAGLDLPPDAVGRIAELIEIKSQGGEGARIRRPPEIDALMRAEFEAARQTPPGPEGPDHREEATALFRRLVLGRSEA